MASRERLGVCVVGLGMGYGHAEAYSNMEDVDLYLCDLNPDRLKWAQKRLSNVKGSFPDISEVWGCAEIVAVDAALPHHLHCLAAVQAARHGKHFMTEKPMARTLAEADQMIEAHKKAGTILMVGENQRFMPAVSKAKELIDNGFLGKVFLVRVYEMWYSNVQGWRRQKEFAGGGNLIDSGIHAIDSLRMLGGAPVKTVYAQTSREVLLEVECEDTAHVSVTFADGAMGDLITSWGIRQPGPQPRFSVYGTEGSLWVMSNDPGSLYFTSIRLPEGSGPVQVRLPVLNTVEAECRHFVECIREGKEPIMCGLEGRRDLEVVLAAYESAETGLPVELPLTPEKEVRTLDVNTTA